MEFTGLIMINYTVHPLILNTPKTVRKLNYTEFEAKMNKNNALKTLN